MADVLYLMSNKQKSRSKAAHTRFWIGVWALIGLDILKFFCTFVGEILIFSNGRVFITDTGKFDRQTGGHA